MNDSTAVPPNAIFPPHNLPPTGWLCPRCGMANAPWLSQCSCAPQPVSYPGVPPSLTPLDPPPAFTITYDVQSSNLSNE